jgi:PIN domain nuclease of toxin-antitoxin system
MPTSESARIHLLDTHVWVWLVHKDQRILKSAALPEIEMAEARGGLSLSVISVWEVAMLESKGRLTFTMDCPTWVNRALAQPGLNLLTLTPDIAVSSTRLPGNLHGDPADRMIVATALQHRASLITADERLIEYARQGHLNVLPV